MSGSEVGLVKVMRRRERSLAATTLGLNCLTTPRPLLVCRLVDAGWSLLTPWAHPLEALDLSPLQGWLLLACCLNTLVAYGAFAEALAHWEASRVSATLAITPLVTFASVALAASLWPEFVLPEDLNGLAYVGALLVVSGSALTALAPSLLRSYRARRARIANL